MLKCVTPSVLTKNTWRAVRNLMKIHHAKRRWIHEVFNWNVLSMTEKRSRNYHDHKRWKKNYLKLHRLRKKPVTDPLREEVTAIPCHELLSSISLRTSIILEREQGVSIEGKNIRYSNGRTPIKSLSYSSPLDYELSLLFGSACRASPKMWKKRSA